jgi:hypothetical protein
MYAPHERLEPAPATPGIYERSVLAVGGVSKSKHPKL